jgi:hypothetical protein
MAAVYVGTIETAFSALMKLSLRLMAERGRDDRLGYYLDDPIQLFVPARLLLGLIFSLATVLSPSDRALGPDLRVAGDAALLGRRLHRHLRAPDSLAHRAAQPEAGAGRVAASLRRHRARDVADLRRLVRLLTSGRPSA